MNREWTVIYENGRGVTNRQEVTPWRPGDGLFCTLGKRQSKVPCGKPAALVRITETRGLPWNTGENRTYVCCANHLAHKARQAVEGTGDSYRTPGISQTAEKAAREEVLAAHWDDFIAARDRIATEIRDDWLSVLPQELRDAARAAIERDEEVAA